MFKTLRQNRAVVGFVILCLGVAMAVGLASLAINRIDERNNATRCSVVGLVQKLTINSARNAGAQIASTTATPAEKSAAKQNLDTIREVLRATDEALGHPHGAACPPLNV